MGVIAHSQSSFYFLKPIPTRGIDLQMSDQERLDAESIGDDDDIAQIAETDQPLMKTEIERTIIETDTLNTSCRAWLVKVKLLFVNLIIVVSYLVS